ncbi:MAG: diacylglycerol kinase family protein [Thermoleophilaceae bacterium]
MSTERRFLLLVNPAAAAGKALDRLPAAVAEFDRLGARHRVVETRGMEHARDEAQAALEAGETIAALGGDGLLRPLVGVLTGADSALAILPGGRGNDLARVLGVPTGPAEAARLAVQGSERMLDVAYVEGTPYLGIASFGFDSEANRIANNARFVRGNLVYLYAALRALVQWKAALFTVTVDGERHELSGYSVAVANSKAYGGGMFMAPHAVLDDGLLDVVATQDAPKGHFLRSLPKVFKGTHLDDPSVVTFRGARIEVAADRPFEIYADGDPIGVVPSTIHVEPRCLRVIAPSP